MAGPYNAILLRSPSCGTPVSHMQAQIKTSLRNGRHLPGTGCSAAGYWLAAPGIAALLVLFLVPTIAVFLISLTDWQIGTDQLSFIGLHNFRILAIDPDFRSAIFNTVAYTLMMAPAT